MIVAFVKVIILISISPASCSIGGLSYMDPITQRPLDKYPRGEDPCNPLYWYPRHVPDYCNKPLPAEPCPLPAPLPPITIAPIPVPVPVPVPVPCPNPPPIPISIPVPIPIQPPMPIPYGVPVAPVSSYQFPAPLPPPPPMPPAMPPGAYPGYYPRQRAGLVPGIEGLVSEDGGINILPFSDAYADLLEKRKQKLIRKKMERILEDYDEFPRRRHRKRGRRPYGRRGRRRYGRGRSSRRYRRDKMIFGRG